MTYAKYKFTPTDVARLQTSYWWHAAAKKLGEENNSRAPIWFAKNFQRPHTVPKKDVSNWKKYKKAKSSATRVHGFHPVEAVEKDYSGTRLVFDLLIWEILKRKKVSTAEIEDEISSMGTRVFTIRDRKTNELVHYPGFKIGDYPEDKYIVEYEPYGLIGRLILDDDFWNKDADDKIIQLTRFSTLKNIAGFELLQAIILMLAWADTNGDPELWNDLCDFYDSMIPNFILDEDIHIRFKLLDVVDDYARHRIKVPFREPIMPPKAWELKVPELQKFYTDYYADRLAYHHLFFTNKIPEDMRVWWAHLLADTVLEDERLWKSGRDLWRPAGSLFFKLVKNNTLEIKLSRRTLRTILRSKKNKYVFPENTTELKMAIKKNVTRYLDDPDNSEDEYSIKLTG